MNEDFITLLDEFEKEKGISRDILIDALETALVSAYKRNYGSNQDVRVEINRTSGGMSVFLKKYVVEEVEDADVQISLDEAVKIDPKYQLGDVVEFPTAPRTFGRIAAQTARQVVTQRIREAERGMFYNQFADKVNDVVSGVVQRVEKKSVMLRVGNSDAMLMQQEQVETENYTPGQRLKLFVVDVQRATKGPQVVISRTHSGLVKKLFELEVPEIASGVVEIKAVSREAGSRSKIAVWASDPNVDPIGACVGPKGARVQAVVDELMGEKIDIIKYSENPGEFVSAALAPTKVLSYEVNEEEKICTITVSPSQLSLAIGKEGQNVRLAAKLTGWKIDIIKSEGDDEDEA